MGQRVSTEFTEMKADTVSFQWTIKNFSPFKNLHLMLPPFTAPETKHQWQFSVFTRKEKPAVCLLLCCCAEVLL